jgi:hypothetical protein
MRYGLLHLQALNYYPLAWQHRVTASCSVAVSKIEAPEPSLPVKALPRRPYSIVPNVAKYLTCGVSYSLERDWGNILLS